MNKKKEKRRFIILCLAPAVILFTVFMVYPTINVFLMSTLKWGGFSDEKTFVGLNNFLILFKDMNFIRAFQNTIFVIVIVTIFTLALAIIFASILVREKLKGQNFFRVIFYIPNILSIVVIGAIFSAIYDPSANGLLNSFLGLFMGRLAGYSLFRKSIYCHVFNCFCINLASHWILYGYVYGKYVIYPCSLL